MDLCNNLINETQSETEGGRAGRRDEGNRGYDLLAHENSAFLTPSYFYMWVLLNSTSACVCVSSLKDYTLNSLWSGFHLFPHCHQVPIPPRPSETLGHTTGPVPVPYTLPTTTPPSPGGPRRSSLPGNPHKDNMSESDVSPCVCASRAKQ